jgi:hypothetical protein
MVTYIYNGTTNSSGNFAPDFDGEMTLLGHTRSVGKGGVLDLTRHATYHPTIIDGSVVAEVNNIFFTCD